MARLARLTIFPIKSLDGVDLVVARILPSGAIQNDRRLAMVDSAGALINGKRSARVHRVRAEFDLAAWTVKLAYDGRISQDWHLDRDRVDVANWLSCAFETPVSIIEDAERGFPDDLDSPGPTVVGSATLAEVTSWYPGLAIEAMRCRLRVNLELETDEPFWEDRLFAGVGESVRLRIGELTFEGINPCQRCVVPSRDSRTGAVTPEFSTTFARRRRDTLPAWTIQERFDHFYRIAVNTRLSIRNSGSVLRVGDCVEVLP